MAVSVGTRIGVYEIVAAIGTGGMGEVYRGRDTKLNRHIAIKVLPDLFANDPDRLARFHREAQVLAALNHPNIAHIHGFEDSDGIYALVMELVDGPTLAERIAQGPIPLTEALPIAKQVAEALEAAHDQGIIHRDLKPANVKVSDDDVVKVLDFGLAKALEPATRADPAASPTITSPAMTRAGMILGTAAYMSPEQAKGRQVDARSDVWAFGALLYEMLSGQRAFAGDEVVDTLASVLKSEPDWTALPADLPTPIHTLIRRCLVKDPRQRVTNISTVLYVISEAAGSGVVSSSIASQQPSAVAAAPASRWRRLMLPLAAAVIAGAAVGAGMWATARSSAPRVTRFALAASGAQVLQVDAQSTDLMITPDGSRIVYKGGIDSRTTQLFVRAVDALEPTPLTAIGQPKGPFPSPDGQWVGFFEPGPPVSLEVAATGGPAMTLSSIDGASRGASWGDDGIIFATAAPSTGLMRVAATGGEPTVLTKPNRERGEVDHVYPHVLPGGKAALFTITTATRDMDTAQVAVLDLRTAEHKTVVRGGSQAYYVASGHLVYVAAGTLRAVRFDLDRLETTGAAVPVLSEVVTLPTGAAEFDIARDGTLVYVVGGSAEETTPRRLVWVDRQGREEPVKGALARPYLWPRLSPDGTRLAVTIRDRQDDIWVWDFARETLTKVTTHPGFDQAPVWMPDGLSLVFSSQSGGAAGALFRQAADGTGMAEQLTESANIQRPSAVVDARRVLFWEGTATTSLDVLMLTLGPDRLVQPLVQTQGTELRGEVSPDGRWLAYESNDSGQSQIVVRPFPNVNDGRVQVSPAGGTEPRWASSPQELFYLGPRGAVMSISVGRGTTWTPGPPKVLIDRSYYGARARNASTYDVSLDGQRFLMMQQDGPSAPSSIVVVQNWAEELKRLLRTDR